MDDYNEAYKHINGSGDSRDRPIYGIYSNEKGGDLKDYLIHGIHTTAHLQGKK